MSRERGWNADEEISSEIQPETSPESIYVI